MNILVFAPHRDDEILGVGGTILKRKAARKDCLIFYIFAKSFLISLALPQVILPSGQ